MIRGLQQQIDKLMKGHATLDERIRAMLDSSFGDIPEIQSLADDLILKVKLYYESKYKTISEIKNAINESEKKLGKALLIKSKWASTDNIIDNYTDITFQPFIAEEFINERFNIDDVATTIEKFCNTVFQLGEYKTFCSNCFEI